MTSNATGPADLKVHLVRYLRSGREALRWKLEGLSPYDLRRPMTPTATNLLGLVKHVACVNADYFGLVFDRPFPRVLPWLAEDAEDNADLWVPADESTEMILALWDEAWVHADATVEALPLEAPGEVPWWPVDRRAVTLGQVLVHAIAELDRHAGHADVVRELIDGRAGLRADNGNLPEGDPDWWQAYRSRVEDAARAV